MDFLLGLDIGTSSVKAVLMRCDGKIENVITKKHNYYEENGFKLMNGEEFKDNCFSVIKDISSQLGNEDCICSVCISGAGGNLVLVKDGECITPVYGWQTSFDSDKINPVMAKLDADYIYETIGWPKLDSFPLATLSYLKETNPKIIKDADTVGMHIEYLNFALTGNWAITRSMGTTFYLIDQEKGEYSDKILSLLGITTDKLPVITEPCTVMGRVTTEASEKTGLKAGTPVIAGTFDHPSAARGAGVFSENQVLVSCGTSWVVFVPFDERAKPLKKGILVDPFMAQKGNWCGMMSLPSVSDTIDKYKKIYLGEVSYKEFDELASESPKGANGLIIDSDDTDVSGYSREDIARAIMENIAGKLKELLDNLENSVDVIKMVGGITNSEVWIKVVSEITGKKVAVVNGEHAGAIGSAIMAGVGAGIYADEISAFNKLNFEKEE